MKRMLKDCDNCYWRGYKNSWCVHERNKPIANTCEMHSFTCVKCDDDISEYKFKGEYVCTNCLLKEFEVEESTITHYYVRGEYIGSDEDMDEVILNLDDDIEELD